MPGSTGPTTPGPTNHAPGKAVLTGQISGVTSETLAFSCLATDPDGGQLTYQLDVDADGTPEDSSAAIDSGTPGLFARSFGTASTPALRCRAKDSAGAAGEWSADLSLTIRDAAGTAILTVARVGGGTVASTPAGIECGLDCSEGFTLGTPVTLLAAAPPGWTFDGWSGACAGSAASVEITVNAASACVATFSAVEVRHPLTVEVTGPGSVVSNPAGIACPGDCAEDFLENAPVTLAALADSGWRFKAWGGACAASGTSVATVSMSAALSCSVTFELNPLVTEHALSVTVTGQGTVSSSPSGVTCPSDCDQSFSDGATIMLTASPTSGWQVGSWGGACATASSNMAVLVMSADRACSVTFMQMPATRYPVNLTVTGAGRVTSAPAGIDCPGDCTQSYDAGSSVTLTATASWPWTFVRWTGDCANFSPSIISLVVTKAMSCGAAFQSSVPELCNGADDNGDGVTDEGIGSTFSDRPGIAGAAGADRLFILDEMYGQRRAQDGKTDSLLVEQVITTEGALLPAGGAEAIDGWWYVPQEPISTAIAAWSPAEQRFGTIYQWSPGSYAEVDLMTVAENGDSRTDYEAFAGPAFPVALAAGEFGGWLGCFEADANTDNGTLSELWCGTATGGTHPVLTNLIMIQPSTVRAGVFGVGSARQVPTLGYGIVWSAATDDGGSDADLYAAMLDSTGAPLSLGFPNPALIKNTSQTLHWQPALADGDTGTSDTGLAWVSTNRATGLSDVRFGKLGPFGLSSEVVVSTTQRQGVRTPLLTWTGDRYLLVWTALYTGNVDAFAVELDSAGVIRKSERRLFQNLGASPISAPLALKANGSAFLLGTTGYDGVGYFTKVACVRR